MKGRTRFLPLFVAAVCLVLAGWWRAGAEKAEGEKSKAEKAAMERLMKYGGYWSPFADSLALYMRPLFEYEKEVWRRKTGWKNPFFPNANDKAADMMWYAQWVQATLRVLRRRGWSLAGVEGGLYVFTGDASLLQPLPERLKRYEGEIPLLPEPRMGEAPGGMGPFPLNVVRRPHGKSYEPFVEARYGNRPLLIPPWARSLRIYCNVPIDATWYSFKRVMPWLHIPAIGDKLFRIRYDGGRFNVVRLYFDGDPSPGDIFSRTLWEWRRFRIYLKWMYSWGGVKYFKEGEKPFEFFAWEFLDEDGKPLPADLPIAVRWFADDFDKIFKPIPLPEELKALPEAQD